MDYDFDKMTPDERTEAFFVQLAERKAERDAAGGIRVGDTVTIRVKVIEVSDTGKCWKGALTDDESAIWFDADDID